MGVVYRAYDRILDDEIALKVLRPDAKAEDLAKRIRSEIKLARHIRHPNVCAIHDYGEDGQWRFISMELIEGHDLKQLIRDRGPFPIAEGCEIALQIAAGLAAVHKAGIIHRDLKAANIMLDASGTVRLMDFGIARRVTPGTTASLTLSGQVVGSPEYMSPEQARGEALDVRSDIYSLGVVLYEVFGGKVPFQGDTPVATILKHLQEPPPLEPEQRGRIPEALCALLRKALAKSRDDRYSSVREMAAEIEDRRNEAARTGATPTSTQYRLAVPAVATPPEPSSTASWHRAAIAFGVLVAGAAVVLPTRIAREDPPPASPSPSLIASAAPAPASSSEPDPRHEVAAVRSAPIPPKESARTAPATAWSPLPIDIPQAVEERLSVPAVLKETAGLRKPSPVPAATVAPPPTTVPPTTAPAPGILKLHVVPWADIEVNGRKVGQTPFEPMSLAAGEYTIRFVHPDYHPLTRQIVVASGTTTRLSVDFTWEGFRRR
jgi:serine/threonine-protein kinase